MVYLEIFIMGVGLSFDAMAAAISLGGVQRRKNETERRT